MPGLAYLARVRGSWYRSLAWRRIAETPHQPPEVQRPLGHHAQTPSSPGTPSTPKPPSNTSPKQEPRSPGTTLHTLSPAIHEHINLYGKYDFTNPTPPPPGQLRPLRTPETAPSRPNIPLTPYTTSARKESSGARPSGDAPRKQNALKTGVVERGPPVRRRRRRTPERRNYETRVTSGSWTGPDAGWVGSDLARRFGWHVAEQAALEVDRVVRLGRPVRNRQGLATHFACCFARPQLCHRRHQGACGDMRLNQHRGRRLDENLESRTPHGGSSPEPSPTPAPNPATRPGRPVPVTAPEPRVIDQAQLEAALARLPAPLAAQLARLAGRYGTSSESTAQASRRDTPHL